MHHAHCITLYIHTKWDVLYIYWDLKSSVLLVWHATYIKVHTITHIHIHGEHSALLYSFSTQN